MGVTLHLYFSPHSNLFHSTLLTFLIFHQLQTFLSKKCSTLDHRWRDYVASTWIDVIEELIYILFVDMPTFGGKSPKDTIVKPIDLEVNTNTYPNGDVQNTVAVHFHNVFLRQCTFILYPFLHLKAVDLEACHHQGKQWSNFSSTKIFLILGYYSFYNFHVSSFNRFNLVATSKFLTSTNYSKSWSLTQSSWFHVR